MYTAYYSLVYTEEVPDTEDTTKKIVYSGYKPKYGHPMCLYSSDGFPIALLELRYQNKNLYNEGHDSFITELPSNTDQTKQSFQAITTKDNEAIEFVITNTTESYINFNLMKCDENVTSVNPGGLNQVNELRPLESYTVKSDQTLGNRILKLISHKTSDGKNTKLKDEIKTEKQEQVGSYLFLSIVPKLGESLCQRFTETFWKPVDYFVIKTISKTPKYTSSLESFNGSLNELEGIANAGASYMQLSALNSDDTLYYGRSRGSSSSGNNIQRGGYEKQSSIKKLLSIPLKKASKSMLSNSDDEEEEDEYIQLSANKSKSIKHSRSKPTTNQIMESKVANISVGEEIINVSSQETDIMYDYDKSSKPCVLGLSVMEGFKLNVLTDEQIKNEIIELIKTYLNNTYTELISQMKIYNSDSCCICLSEEPDTIFYRCGHACIDSGCMKKMDKCPICRQNIAATVPYTNKEKNVIQNTTKSILSQI